jgi:ACS family hexuronate transporter-like MFS transporter
MTESGNFPSAIKTIAEWFPKKERALATGIFNSGTNIGAIVAPLTVPFIAKEYGWRWAFIITGAVGLIWLLFWFWFMKCPLNKEDLSRKNLITYTVILMKSFPWQQHRRQHHEYHGANS